MDMHTNGEMGSDHTCNCGYCKSKMGMDWRMMRAVRILTAVIVIIFVFWCGFEFGEIRSSLGMSRGFGYGTMQHEGYGMMGEGSDTVLPPTVTNADATAGLPGGAGSVTQ